MRPSTMMMDTTTPSKTTMMDTTTTLWEVMKADTAITWDQSLSKDLPAEHMEQSLSKDLLVSSDGGRAYYGAKAFKEDGPYYAGAGIYLSSDAAPIQLAALHSESQRDARYEPASGSDAYCCSVVAGQEECSQDMQYNSMKTTFPLNSVDAILCCDGGITTIHDWCAGSVGPSLEKDTKDDYEGPAIIHSEAWSESIQSNQQKVTQDQRQVQPKVAALLPLPPLHPHYLLRRVGCMRLFR